MASILVVEDNAANMTLAVFLLSRRGTPCCSAIDAEAGLALARDKQSRADPDGHPASGDGRPPGCGAAQAGSDARAGIPVIALTALAMKGDEERIRAAGCDGYIAKPMRYQELIAAIDRALGTA